MQAVLGRKGGGMVPGVPCVNRGNWRWKCDSSCYHGYVKATSMRTRATVKEGINPVVSSHFQPFRPC